MKKYFNIYFHFEYSNLKNIIKSYSKKGKGYCCFVDTNSLVYSHKNKSYRNILNKSLLNFCDGSYIAIMINKIHKINVNEYTGPDFFKKFIYHNDKQIIIGNTESVFKKIKFKVKTRNNFCNNLNYLSIPFLSVDEFNYIEIGKSINNIKPKYIWISLGAPKQEIFMSKLLPHIESGIMFGIGAATNYFSGEIRDIPKWIKKVHLIWLYRLLTEPKKQFKRLKLILLNFPKMILNENRRIKQL